MFDRSSLVGVVGVVALGVAAPAARAGGLEDFATALRDASGESNPSLVLTRLHTFEVGARCLAKLASKEQRAVHTAGFTTRDVVAYARTITGSDWDAIENQDSNDRDANRALIEPMIDAFRSRFALTIAVEGDDCDAGHGSLWLRYWHAITTAVKSYPPPSGKAFITLRVTSKARGVTTSVSKDGTTFTITAPKDVESPRWAELIERPFRQLHSGIADDFAYGVKASTGDHNAAWVLTKLHRFEVGKRCRARLGDHDGGAIHTAGFATREVLAWARDSMGAKDWDAIESQSANDPETNLRIVEQDMDAFRERFSFTIRVEGDDCDAGHGSLWLRYWFAITQALKDHPPRAKKVAITLNVTSKAKAVVAKASKDGATFTITAPRDKEHPAWNDAIQAAFRKVSRRR